MPSKKHFLKGVKSTVVHLTLLQSEAKSNSTKIFCHRLKCIFMFTVHLIKCNVIKKILMFCNIGKVNDANFKYKIVGG